MTERADSAGERPAEGRIDVASLAFCLLANYLLRSAGNCAGIALTLYLASLRNSGIMVRAEMIGLASLLFYLMELLGSPLFGMISDARGRKPVMLLGPVFGGAAIALLVVAPTIPVAIGSRLLAGLSTASSVPSALSFLSAETAHSDHARARVMGFYELASITGIASGLVAAGFLWDTLRFNSFYVIAGMYVLSLLLFVLVRDRHAVHRHAQSLSVQLEALRRGPTLRLMPAWVAVNAIVGLWFNHLSFQMARPDDPSQLLVGGFSGRQIGLYTGAVVLLFVVGIGIWTLFLGKLKATRVMSIAIAGAFGLVLVLALLNHVHPAEVRRVIVYLGLAGILLLIVSGFTPAALTYLANLAEETPRLRGSVMGIYTVLLGVGQALGAVLGGYFADWRGVDGMIVYTGILALISATFVASLARRDSQSEASQVEAC